MYTVLAQMAALVACGVAWQRFAPAHIPPMAHRRALTDLVFFILLPALVLNVIWQASLSLDSVKIALLAMTGLATGALSMTLVLRFFNTTRPQTGALMLAATFPNVTYLGLPVLDQVIGSQTNAIVLQYDLFACTPLLMTVGMLLAAHFGEANPDAHPARALVKIPPLWAVVIAVSLNLLGIEQPETIGSALTLLSGGVVPLMLIALGMSIRWDTLHARFLKLLLPVVIISLLLVPAAVWSMTLVLPLDTQILQTVVLAGAMPTMLFGLVICDRFQLDSGLYAAAVTLTTVLCIFSLSFWFSLLTVN